MTQPEGLKTNQALVWSPGTGADLWELFCACVDGRREEVERLLKKDPSLARAHFNYRKAIYFAVRENRVEIAEMLFDRDPDPIGLAVNDTLLEIAQDRGYAKMEAMLRRKLAERAGDGRGEAVAAAIRAGDLKKVKRLLDREPDLLRAGDARGNLPIHWAAMTRRVANRLGAGRNHPGIVKLTA